MDYQQTKTIARLYEQAARALDGRGEPGREIAAWNRALKWRERLADLDHELYLAARPTTGQAQTRLTLFGLI